MQVMVPCICFGLSVLSALAQQSTGEIQIHNVRASKLLQTVQSGSALIEKGVVLQADDERGTIRLIGPADGVGRMKKMLSLFDVKPQLVEFTVDLDSAVDKAGFSATVKIANNQMWKATDSDTGATIGVRPIIGDDGKLTLMVRLQCRGGATESVVRLKQGTKVSITGPSEAAHYMFVIPYIGPISVQKVLPGPVVTFSLNKA